LKLRVSEADMDAKSVAKRGKEIYSRKYKSELEKTHHGEYVAIDVNSGLCYLGSTAGEATRKAEKKNPRGPFYLLRIGFASVYRMGSMLTDADYSIL
jgi:hypothetical protein